MARWSPASDAGQRLADLAVHRLDRALHALAAIALAAVAQLMRLMRAGRGAGGHRGAAEGAALQHHVHLDGGVAAAVENFPADDGSDCGHDPSIVGAKLRVTGPP